MQRYLSHVALFMFALASMLFISGCSLATNISTNLDADDSQQEHMNDDMMNDNKNMMDDDMMNDNKNMMDDDMMQGEKFSLADDSFVSYTAAKKWFSKPVEDVVGTNKTVEGGFTYTDEKLTGLSVTVDSQTFTTDNGGRDKEIQKILEGSITVSANDINITKETFEQTIPLNVTINGTTKTVDFMVKGTVAEKEITAEGTGKISLEAFNVKAPSLLNVYTVDDTLGVSFTMTAKK